MKTWLPIKKDYLIENFDNLLTYLSEVDYTKKDDVFLSETVDILHEVAKDLLLNKFSHRLGVLDIVDTEFVRNIKIVFASLYASFRRKKDIDELLLLLLDTIVVNELVEDEAAQGKIMNIVTKLASGGEIKSLPFSLNDINKKDAEPKLLSQILLSISLECPTDGKRIFRGKGEAVLEADKFSIIASNASNLKDKKLKVISKLSFDIDLISNQKKSFYEEEFKERVNSLNILSQSLKETKIEERKLKTYSKNDVFYVVVSSKEIKGESCWFVCTTIDPSYELMENRLNLPPEIRVDNYNMVKRSELASLLDKGSIIKVSIEEINGKEFFSINRTLENFYFNLNEMNHKQDAVYIKKYSQGTTWLTSQGRLVNIKDNPFDEEIDDAAEEGIDCGIELEIQNVIEDINGKSKINAFRVGDIIEDIEYYDFIRDAKKTFIDDLLAYWKEDCPTYEGEEKFEKLEEIYIKIICHLFSARSEDQDSPFDRRYMDAFASKILAAMLSDEHDENYSESSLIYLRALWAFSNDIGHEWLKTAEFPSKLSNLESVGKKREILKILSDYKEATHHVFPQIGNEVDVDRVRKLVEASNTLNGNISNYEIIRIKRTIAKCLGIESIFVEPISEGFSFGEESDMLEFKSSIVFTPVRKGTEVSSADPDTQIWAIIKTVNGFLNSLHGGTLLIGVNDNGYPTGIEEDIKWLTDYRNLLAPNVDRYIQYVKMRLDNSFEAYKRKDRNSDITSTRLRYTSSKTEGKSILRIDVLPYEMGCVKIIDTLSLPTGDKIDRPSYLKEAYIRNANTTEVLTDIMRAKVESDKRSVIKDSEVQNLIGVQEAIETDKMIELIDYQSASGKGNRTIYPIELLPLRGLVVGYEKGEKKLRVYKLKRCSSVTILNERPNFVIPSKTTYYVDPFNMLVPDIKKAFKLILRLDRLGWLLLKENYPYSENCLIKDKHDYSGSFPYVLQCDIADVKGIGSFCMSILGHFKIIDCPELENYLAALCNAKW